MDAHSFLTGLWILTPLGGATATATFPAAAPGSPTHGDLAFVSLAAGLLLLLVCVVASSFPARHTRVRRPSCSVT